MTFKKGDIVRVNGRRGTIHSELPTMPGHEPFYYVQFLPFTPLDLIPAHMITPTRDYRSLLFSPLAVLLLAILVLYPVYRLYRMQQRIAALETAKESR